MKLHSAKMESTSYLSNTSTEEFSEMLGKNILGVEEAGKTDGVCFGDLLVANKHEPLDASHGAQIMAKEVGVAFYRFYFFELTIKFSAAFTKEAAIHYNDGQKMG